MTDRQAAQPNAAPTSELWMLHDMEFATVVTVQKPGRFIALCEGVGNTDEENLAHAELIAAAPATAAERDRLLTVLGNLIDALPLDVVGLVFSERLSSAIANARYTLDETARPPQPTETVKS